MVLPCNHNACTRACLVIMWSIRARQCSRFTSSAMKSTTRRRITHITHDMFVDMTRKRKPDHEPDDKDEFGIPHYTLLACA